MATVTKKTKINLQQSNVLFFHLSYLLTACCDLATHLYKHSKEELRAQLLDSLGHGFLVITVRCLFMDLFC